MSNLILLRGGDLASDLTQVLSQSGAQLPGSPITYLYGNGHIAQYPSSGTMSKIVNQQSQIEYFLPDALGSVRQLTDPSTSSGQAPNGQLTLAKNYNPYGESMQSAGAASSSYGFTGEHQTGGLVYLRARMYAPSMGRFLTRDTWDGDEDMPMSYNRWAYVYGNPVNKLDPTGHFPTPITPSVSSDDFTNSILGSLNPLLRCRLLSGFSLGALNLSAYYMPLEHEWGGPKIPIKSFYGVDPETKDIVQMYLPGRTQKKNVTLKAHEDLLYSTEGVCMQGSAILETGQIIHCGFDTKWLLNKKLKRQVTFSFWSKQELIPFETVAACTNSKKFYVGLMVQIPGLKDLMPAGHDDIFKVTDNGGGAGLCSGNEGLDVYLGEGKQVFNIPRSDDRPGTLFNAIVGLDNSEVYR